MSSLDQRPPGAPKSLVASHLLLGLARLGPAVIARPAATGKHRTGLERRRRTVIGYTTTGTRPSGARAAGVVISGWGGGEGGVEDVGVVLSGGDVDALGPVARGARAGLVGGVGFDQAGGVEFDVVVEVAVDGVGVGGAVEGCGGGLAVEGVVERFAANRSGCR